MGGACLLSYDVTRKCFIGEVNSQVDVSAYKLNFCKIFNYVDYSHLPDLREISVSFLFTCSHGGYGQCKRTIQMSVDYHLPRRPDSTLPLSAMPVPTVAEPALDHQRRFEAAVDVIKKLPKNGLYQPSYRVMLRFYGLYKQAVCGPCNQPRPGFWDPVGRYKWDAWSRIGGMSSEGAMATYVDEMKKVAKEVLETLPVNEKTASLIHHFEPLYRVVDDMPLPPQELLDLRQGVNGSRPVKYPEDMKMSEDEDEGHEEAEDLAAPSLETGPGVPESPELSANPLSDSGRSKGLAPTSDSESEIFCDSLDSEEQLLNTKIKTNGFQNGHSDPSSHQPWSHETVAGATQVGSGQGGEGAGEDKGPRRRRSHSGRGGPEQGWRERGAPPGSPRPPGRGAPNMGGGGGGGGRGGPEGGAERLHDAQLQQQIVVALRRLREDMRSVMERLEAVEHLAAAHAQNEDWTLCSQCANASNSPEGEKWWPFDVSGHTMLLLLMWPLVAQGLVMLLRRAQKRGCVSS
ncbi:unnamed protein product [Boreogadus saida]